MRLGKVIDVDDAVAVTRVRSEADIQRIVASEDKLPARLGHRFNAIVIDDGVRVDDDVMPACMDAVKYVAERYRVNATRTAV